MRTRDLSCRWRQSTATVGITYPAPSDYLEPPHFTDRLQGFAVFLTQQPDGATPGTGKFGGQAMVFYRTSDGGRTWVSWVDFANPRDGFAGDPGSSALLITSDGGRTWRSVSSG